jgi:hypothetical protein
MLLLAWRSARHHHPPTHLMGLTRTATRMLLLAPALRSEPLLVAPPGSSSGVWGRVSRAAEPPAPALAVIGCPSLSRIAGAMMGRRQLFSRLKSCLSELLVESEALGLVE